MVWYELASRYTRDIKLLSGLWPQIQSCYSSPGRFYHNCSHLDYMMKKAIRHKSRLTDPDIVMFSIFYHDLVYDPLRNDNEEKSAIKVGEDLIKLGVTGNKIVTCQNQIMATKDHHSRVDEDTNYLIDFDLAILGECPELYLEYSKNIRKEYAIYNDLLYKTGRKKVIGNFLERESLFTTGWFYENYELRARENLENELENL